MSAVAVLALLAMGVVVAVDLGLDGSLTSVSLAPDAGFVAEASADFGSDEASSRFFSGAWLVAAFLAGGFVSVLVPA